MSFPVIRHPATAGALTIEPGYRTLLAANGLDSLDALFAVEGAQSLDKPGLPAWRERIRLELTDGHGRSHCLYLKRYRSPPIGQQIRWKLSGQPWHSTAWVEWRWARALRESGIPAARPVALGEKMIGAWERRSALLTTAVPGESLEKWAQRCPGRAPRELLERLARLVADLHGRGLVHRDLYLSHVFIDEAEVSCQSSAISSQQSAISNQSSASGGAALWLIDLQRVLRPRWRWRRWVIKDLAALNYSTPASVATATDRLRWLQLYLGVSKLRPRDRILVRKIVAKTRRIARHERLLTHRTSPCETGSRAGF